MSCTISIAASLYKTLGLFKYILCDEDKDGYISLRELEIFIKKENSGIPEMNLPALVQKAYAKSDLNHDDKLDLEEFIKMLKSPSFNEMFNNIGQRYIKFLVVPPNGKKITLNRTVTATGQYEEQSKCSLTTITMPILSLVQVILYYASNQKLKIKLALSYIPGKKYELWRLLTPIFIHIDEMHLYFNLVFQLLFCIPLEMVHTWRVPVVYCLGAIGGTLLHAIEEKVPLFGASAGVFAIGSAHIASVVLNWREMSNPLAQLLIFAIFLIFEGIYQYVTRNPDDSVSYVTHLGGAICGLLIGVPILRNIRVTRVEKYAWWICLTAYILFMISLFIAYFVTTK